MLGRQKGHLEVVGAADRTLNGEEAEEALVGLWQGVLGMAVPRKMTTDSSKEGPPPFHCHLALPTSLKPCGLGAQALHTHWEQSSGPGAGEPFLGPAHLPSAALLSPLCTLLFVTADKYRANHGMLLSLCGQEK